MTKETQKKEVRKLRLELAKEKAQISIGGAPSNPGKVKQLRKTIARLLTEVAHG